MEPTSSRDRRWERWVLPVAFFLLAASAATYFFCVGNHHHSIEINTQEGVVRITSRTSAIRVSVPGKPYEITRSLVGYDGIRTLGWSRILPMDVKGYGITRTSQQLDLKTNRPVLEFSVNDRTFRLEDGKMHAAGQVWELKPGATVEIRVDRLREE